MSLPMTVTSLETESASRSVPGLAQSAAGGTDTVPSWKVESITLIAKD